MLGIALPRGRTPAMRIIARLLSVPLVAASLLAGGTVVAHAQATAQTHAAHVVAAADSPEMMYD